MTENEIPDNGSPKPEPNIKNKITSLTGIFLRLFLGFFAFGGGFINLTKINNTSHSEEFIGVLGSVLLLLGLGCYLFYSAIKALNFENLAVKPKTIIGTGIFVSGFSLICAYTYSEILTQRLGMICDDFQEQALVRIVNTPFSSTFSIRNGEDKWSEWDEQKTEKNGGRLTESIFIFLTQAEEKKGAEREVFRFDFLLKEHIRTEQIWNAGWIEKEKYVFDCKPADLF